MGKATTKQEKLRQAKARLRTEIDSMPAELDEITRRILQLEIEREALRKETDAASRDRLAKLEKELTELQGKAQTLRAQWESEKGAIERPRQLRKQIEETKIGIDKAMRVGVGRGHEESGSPVYHGLIISPDGRGDHRPTGSHGFQDGKGETFEQ
jgi:ATP-dependent Clp protease ATP-binding subunit ClpA